MSQGRTEPSGNARQLDDAQALLRELAAQLIASSPGGFYGEFGVRLNVQGGRIEWSRGFFSGETRLAKAPK